eukprot:TRINITY_DN628_c0_g1_i1.p1 TRINITY_DN628_c0_g1~~TRINITY_DN628_c0_g1_i1.p1  ORF type:complete len:338 (-),score=65.84 TRINITY_DN628_c0_g1_i1:77-1090(-)
MEYLPIGGLAGFNDKARDLLFGNQHHVVKEKRVIVVQTLSGTGSLRLGGEFLNRFLPDTASIYAPNPTWANHHNIFRDSHRPLKSYAYYEPKTCGLNFEGMVHDLQAAPDHSCILLHTCAHNPTGVDPTPEQWQALVQVFKKKHHLAYFDTAYQGFATGDLDRDAYPVRLFSEHHIPLVFSQSFAKNFGLYGHRVGTFGVVTTGPEETARVESQLKILIRPIWSNPPLHGARVVDVVLNDPDLTALWKQELKTMSHRIIDMREKLYAGLQKRGSAHNWRHITDQIGMFCYTGLKPDQVERLTKEFHVYLTKDGRISMVGLTSDTVDYLANAIHEVTK